MMWRRGCDGTRLLTGPRYDETRMERDICKVLGLVLVMGGITFVEGIGWEVGDWERKTVRFEALPLPGGSVWGSQEVTQVG